jgi:hypothetical protein
MNFTATTHKATSSRQEEFSSLQLANAFTIQQNAYLADNNSGLEMHHVGSLIHGSLLFIPLT